MKKVVRVKLLPGPDVAASLAATLRRCNEAANLASRVHHGLGLGSTAGRALQTVVYQDLKALGLSAQPALLAISKTKAAYATLAASLRNGNHGRKGSERRARTEAKPIVFRADAAQPFDDPCLSWQIEVRTVSIWTVDGRLKGIPSTGRAEDLALLAAHRKGESDLMRQGRDWFLVATVDVPEPAPNPEPAGFLGVDLGIVNIATTSDGANWSGGAVTARRAKNKRLRAKLQTKGTKSAKRLLRKRAGKEARFAKDVNHTISKRIVAEAERTGRGIAVEDLTGIRDRARLAKSQRAAIGSWAFAQLRAFLAYKAQGAGVPFEVVDPAYSSRECSECHHIDKRNRPDRDTFACVCCGVLLDADLNAARNLASRGSLRWGVNHASGDAA